MTVKLLLLISALAFLSVTSAAQDNYRPKQKDLSWGVESAGLRMAVWTNPATAMVFGAVRNFSSRKICYCEIPSHVSYGFIRVYARRNVASEWQALRFKPATPGAAYTSQCVGRYLKPNAEMLSYNYTEQSKTLEKNNYSFFINLREYNFPADWSGTVEVKIVQSNTYCFWTKDNGKGGEVESQTFAIKLPFSETAAQR